MSNIHTSLSLADKAGLLFATFEKHPPLKMRDLALKLMRKAKPGSDEFKCFAALYEYCDVLK